MRAELCGACAAVVHLAAQLSVGFVGICLSSKVIAAGAPTQSLSICCCMFGRFPAEVSRSCRPYVSPPDLTWGMWHDASLWYAKRLTHDKSIRCPLLLSLCRCDGFMLASHPGSGCLALPCSWTRNSRPLLKQNLMGCLENDSNLTQLGLDLPRMFCRCRLWCIPVSDSHVPVATCSVTARMCHWGVQSACSRPTCLCMCGDKGG